MKIEKCTSRKKKKKIEKFTQDSNGIVDNWIINLLEVKNYFYQSLKMVNK